MKTELNQNALKQESSAQTWHSYLKVVANNVFRSVWVVCIQDPRNLLFQLLMTGVFWFVRVHNNTGCPTSIIWQRRGCKNNDNKKQPGKAAASAAATSESICSLTLMKSLVLLQLRWAPADLQAWRGPSPEPTRPVRWPHLCLPHRPGKLHRITTDQRHLLNKTLLPVVEARVHSPSSYLWVLLGSQQPASSLLSPDTK